jgi:hypothetical protein
LICIKTTSRATRFHSAHPGEWRKHLEDVMSTLKGFTIVAVLLAGATSLAMAQNGPPTGGESPVAGGAGGGGWGYAGGVYGHPGYGYGYQISARTKFTECHQIGVSRMSSAIAISWKDA